MYFVSGFKRIGFRVAPLSQFNHTFPNKDGIFQLVTTLNNALGEKRLKDNIIEQVFKTYWPYFEEKFNEIIEIYQPSVQIVEEELRMIY